MIYYTFMISKELAANYVKEIEAMINDSPVIVVKSTSSLLRRAIINSVELLPVVSGTDVIVININNHKAVTDYSNGNYDLSKAKVIAV